MILLLFKKLRLKHIIRLPLYLLMLLFGIIGATVVALVVASAFGISDFNLSDTLEDLFAPPPPRATVVSSQTILSGIQPLGQLVNISADVAKSDIFINVQEGVLNVCGHSAHHVAEGTVEAGIDLTLVTEEDITYDAATDTYTLSIPRPNLTSCRVDFIRQYERSFSTCPTINWDEARILAQYEAINAFRDDALSGGIVDEAETEAILFLENFVEILTGSNAEVVINNRFTPAVGLSCSPEEPPGWTYVPNENVWIKR
ncbi:MAG: DUF4230 domain-containing protein [Chloroflexi bacterium]|nr:MAG: DUF4230 domain-containing protein [Chloroflexota bacterium]